MKYPSIELTPRVMIPVASKRRGWHDYASKAVYLVTLFRNEEVYPFSELRGSDKPNPHNLSIALLPNGRHIETALHEIAKIFPEVRISAYSILPDYVHMLIHNVSTERRDLTEVVNKIKEEATREFLREQIRKQTTLSTDSLTTLFAGGYDDRIVRRRSDLDRFSNLIERATKDYHELSGNPDFIKRFLISTDDGLEFEGIGNRHLLTDPQIAAVRISRTFSEDELRARKTDWLRTILNGGVIVSPFVSGQEYKVCQWALENNGRIIHVLPNGFPSTYKPEPKLYESLRSGKILLLAPRTHIPDFTRPERSLCIAMNEAAERISTHDMRFHFPENMS